MTWGRCKVCDRLVQIKPRHRVGGGRQADWFPVEHDADGKRCAGVNRPV